MHQRSCESRPHPNPPPQAGEGAHRIRGSYSRTMHGDLRADERDVICMNPN